jgi:hypothetical protein
MHSQYYFTQNNSMIQEAENRTPSVSNGAVLIAVLTAPSQIRL